MISHRRIVSLTLGSYLVGTLLLAGVALLYGCVEYFYLSILTGAPFFLGLLIAQKSRSDLIVVFAAIAFATAWMAPIGFFVEREKFTYSGFSAILNFDFDVLGFVESYQDIAVCFFITLLVGVVLSPRTWPGHIDAPRALRTHRGTDQGAAVRVTLYLSLFVFGCVNWWMFNNSVGITGISPPELPFKLSGLLYYMARFGFPLAIVAIFTRYRPLGGDLLAVGLYACFAAMTSVSKTTLVLIFLPVFISCVLDRRQLALVTAALGMVLVYPLINEARNYVYAVDGGVSVRNVDFSLWDVILNSMSDFEFRGVLAAPLAIVERIGGGQDVALAAQYDASSIGGPMMEFVRIYIFDFFDRATEAQSMMYGYTPEVSGYATGDGGFFAHILLVSGGSLPMLIWVGVYQGLVLAAANATYFRLVEGRTPRALLLFYVAVFCILFFALSIPLWLNAFVVVTFVGTRSDAMITVLKLWRRPQGRALQC